MKNGDSDTFQRVICKKNGDRMIFDIHTFQKVIHNYLKNFKC